MKLAHEFDKEYFCVEYKHEDIDYWAHDVNSTYGTLVMALRHIERNKEPHTRYRVRVIAEGIVNLDKVN